MPDFDASPFLGSMPVGMFLDEFLEMGEGFPTAPPADFSMVPCDDVEEMSSRFVRAVRRSYTCPQLQLYAARTTRRLAMEELPDAQPKKLYNLAGEWVREKVPPKWHYPCPRVMARQTPNARRANRKGHAVLGYYDWASTVLDIEVDPRDQADPFIDHREVDTDGSSSEGQSKVTEDSAKSPQPTGSSVSLSSPPKIPRSSASSSSSMYYEPIENPTEEGQEFRSSIISHATALFTRQHRYFSFTVVLVGRWARLMRWDRAGAILSERFDYVAHPELLAEFLWRFAHLDDERRGMDTTVKPSSKTEAKLFTNAVQEFLADMEAASKDGGPVRRLPDAERTLDSTGTYPIWTAHVTDAVTRRSTQLVINRPFAGRPSVFGRSTRAYIAYDLQERRLVFMKDSWRVDHPKILVESKTYRTLRRHAVPHIPNVLYAGDVRLPNGRPQVSSTQDLNDDEFEWRTSATSDLEYIHHRIVQDIAFPLTSAVDARELLQVIHDVLCTISQAYDVAGILHNDVSLGNVMIGTDGRGILNDWDHSSNKDSPVSGTGTWRFMSSRLLEEPNKPHELSDDLESVFWVFCYAALKRFATPIKRLPFDIFDDAGPNRDGGRRTSLDLRQLSRVVYSSKAIQEMVANCEHWWWGYYHALTGLRMQRMQLLHEIPEEIMKMLDLAVKPSFWIEKFAAALAKCDTRPPSPPYQPSQHDKTNDSSTEQDDTETRHARQFYVASWPGKRKRKGDEEAAQPLRRSKRLKAS